MAFWVLFPPLAFCAVTARITHGALQILDVVAGIVLLVLVAVRACRIGVWADADRVVVQNLWFTHEFNWADVSRIEVSGWRQGDRYAPKRWWFRMHDGKSIMASGLLPLYEVMSDAKDDLLATPRTRVEYSERPAS